LNHSVLEPHIHSATRHPPYPSESHIGIYILAVSHPVQSGPPPSRSCESQQCPIPIFYLALLPLIITPLLVGYLTVTLLPQRWKFTSKTLVTTSWMGRGKLTSLTCALKIYTCLRGHTPLYTPVAQLAYSQAPTGFGNTPTLSLYDGLSLSAELSSAITRPAWNAPPAPASLLLQALHGPLVRCCWSTCNVPLDDVTAGGINRHLQEYHLRSTRSVKEHTVCQWHTSHDVHPCGTQLRFANLGKHVAAIHLQTTASWCKRCGHSFSRTDALRRHEKQYCPQRLSSPRGSISM
ncbi:hypothetical protein B0H21DRAFT_112489, partial [Amylocystis lapponica]